ncbi:MAG: hypothetical protein K5668_07450 [Lachnospiraceae bacterium]|nr:hypothetical protein [Lachnospiraceae bacterium]
MACFLVSAAEAVVVAAVEKAVEKKETSESSSAAVSEEKEVHIPLSRKLKWLTDMLVGGAVLLLFEHIWHGEVVPWFPFLTAMSDASDTAEMLHEMSTVGVCMALLITAVWLVMCKAADVIVSRKAGEGRQEA